MGGVAYDIAKALSGRVDEYIVKETVSYRLMPKIARGEVSVVQSWSQRILDVYASKAGRFTAVSIDADEVAGAAGVVEEVLKRLTESRFYAPLPEPTGRGVSYVDPGIREAVESGDAGPVLDAIQPTGRGDMSGMADLWYQRVRLVGSNGLDVEYERTGFRGYMRVFKSRDASGQWSWTSTRLDLDLAVKAVEKAVETAELCHRLPRSRVEDGWYRVLLSPMIAANLLEGLVNAQNAWNIMTGMSFLSRDSVGEKLYSSLLTVHERPGDTGLPFFTGVDDEGVSTRDRPLIEGGVVRGLIHNSKTARVFGGESTGNAGWVYPVYRNLVVEAGDRGFDELLEELGDGVYLTNNWYTRYQSYVEGVFSTVARDAVFVVKGGKLAGCSSRIRIADVLPRLFSRVEAVSREAWPIQWWEVRHPVVMPYLLVGKARLTSAE